MKENLENFTTNFKRVGALNNLRDKLAVLKVNFPRGEITQKPPMPFKFSRHMKKFANAWGFSIPSDSSLQFLAALLHPS